MRRFFEENLFWLSIGLGLLLLGALVLFFYLQLPPREFTILTGREGGAYHNAALAYQKVAAEKGFTLHVVPTAGSLETLERLQAGEAEFGFAQGGTAEPFRLGTLNTAASVFYEPLWIVYRSEAFAETPVRLGSFAGKRVNLGEEGSGTQVLVNVLLSESGVDVAAFEPFHMATADAIDALAAGTLDVGFFVLSPTSSRVAEILSVPGTQLMSLELADAYAARHHYLNSLTLPKGAIDPAALRPAADTQIVSTVANVIARADVHPDLLRLLTMAMVETHEQGGILEATRQFPSLDYAELPANRVQLAYIERIKRGESTLDNYLPFWAASIIDRYLLFVVPVLLIVVPILSRTPRLYTGLVRMRIRRRYRVIREIDARIHHMQIEDIDRELLRIDEMDEMLAKELQLANQFMPEVYDLRGHLNLLEVKLRRRRARIDGSDSSHHEAPPAHSEEGGAEILLPAQERQPAARGL